MRRFEQYRLDRGVNVADPDFWNAILEDLDLRLNAAEVYGSALDNAVANVEALGVERVNATLNPLVATALAKIASVADLLSAGSASSVTVGDGEKTFVIAESDRMVWPLPAWVVASVVTDPTTYVAGRVISFDRQTGILVVDVNAHGGTGEHASWVVRLAGIPGPKGDAGAAGPKGDTGSLSGNASTLAATAPSGFSGGNVQAVMDSLAGVLSAAVTKNAAQDTALDGKAALYHGHGIGDVSGLQTALDSKSATTHNHNGVYSPVGHSHADTATTYTKHQGFGQTTLADAATIAWDCSSAQTAKVVLGGNRTLGAPTNIVAGFTYILIVKQDAAGTRTLAFDAAYKWPDNTVPVIGTGANKKTMLSFYYDGENMIGVACKTYG
jgi:hypothetical protein